MRLGDHLGGQVRRGAVGAALVQELDRLVGLEAARQGSLRQGHDAREGRRELRRRRIQAKIAAPKTPHGSGLGNQRWVVERTIAWLHQYRRLRVRYERRDDIHEAFLAIGCSLICLKLLQAETSF